MIPLFKTESSIGKSILKINDVKRIADENNLEEVYFSELNNDELFYQTNKPKETPENWRKVGENGAMNVKTRQVHNVNGRTKVYQKI